MAKYEGSCFCGKVKFEVSGDSLGMGYCHCQSCRHWSAGPVNAFSLWKPDSLKITAGQDQIKSYAKTPNSERKWCQNCGGHIYTNHPGAGFVDVFAAMLPTLSFKPGLHVHYGESVLSVKDGLPKMKDMPKEMGGSGETLPE